MKEHTPSYDATWHSSYDIRGFELTTSLVLIASTSILGEPHSTNSWYHNSMWGHKHSHHGSNVRLHAPDYNTNSTQTWGHTNMCVCVTTTQTELKHERGDTLTALNSSVRTHTPALQWTQAWGHIRPHYKSKAHTLLSVRVNTPTPQVKILHYHHPS